MTTRTPLRMRAARTLNLPIPAPRPTLRRRFEGIEQEWHCGDSCNDRDLQHVPSKIGLTYCAVGSNADHMPAYRALSSA